MKSKSRFILNSLIASLCLISCERGTIIHNEIEYIDKPYEPCVSDPAPIYLPGEMLHGRVTGLKNCLPFMAGAELFYIYSNGIIKGANIYMYTYEDWGNVLALKEKIRVGALGSSKGTFSLYDDIHEEYLSSYHTIQDFDVLEDIFKIDTNFNNNEITFSEFDTSKGFVKGDFNCRFILDSLHHPTGHNPDTVTFRDCYFYAWR